jgi:hypothetical protein
MRLRKVAAAVMAEGTGVGMAEGIFTAAAMAGGISAAGILAVCISAGATSVAARLRGVFAAIALLQFMASGRTPCGR